MTATHRLTRVLSCIL